MKSKTRDRRLTVEEAGRYQRLRELVEVDKPQILELAKQYDARRDRVSAIVAELKAQRAARGMSLADVRDRSGIDRSALSRLENGNPENPSLDTLLRYADAVGCQIIVKPAKESR